MRNGHPRNLNSTVHKNPSSLFQPAVDSAKMKNYIKKAVRQAAEYNASLMREKREERQYYLDLQTMVG